MTTDFPPMHAGEPHPNKPWLKKFAKGNQAAKLKKSALERTLAEIPREYHVVCNVLDDREELMMYVETMADFARRMHEAIGKSERVDDNRHVAAYGAIRTSLQAFLNLAQSGRIRGPDFDLDNDQVIAAKREYASILTVNLTRLKYTVSRIEQRHPDGTSKMYSSKGVLWSWAGRDTAEMLGRTLTTIRQWYELQLWEESRTVDSKAQAVEAYAREVSAGAESG